MSQIVKAFTGVFFILLMMCTSIGLLSVFLQTVHAQNLHGAMINELENSNYARPVIVECFNNAQSFGYDLEMTLYSKEGGVVVCRDEFSVPVDCKDITMAELELKYHIKNEFLGVDVEEKLFAYGR